MIGGQPKKALYFLGKQKKDLIFHDPHLCKVAEKDFRPEEMHC